MNRLVSADVVTPAVVVDAETLAEKVRAVRSRFAAGGQVWCPVLTAETKGIWGGIAEFRRLPVATARPEFLEQLISCSINDVDLTVPVAGAGIDLIAKACNSSRVTAVCDHYFQAESLSTACERLGILCDVLVEVRVQPQTLGIRPGPDLMELVRGVCSLTGIRLAGIRADLRSRETREAVNRPDDPDSNTKRIALITAQADELRRHGFACGRVVVATNARHESTESDGVTDFHQHDWLHVLSADPDSDGASREDSPLTLLATVISRPRLDLAVLDVGIRHLGSVAMFPDGLMSTAHGHVLAESRFCTFEDESAAVELGPGSRDLVIGDRVLIKPVAGWTPSRDLGLVFRRDAEEVT